MSGPVVVVFEAFGGLLKSEPKLYPQDPGSMICIPFSEIDTLHPCSGDDQTRTVKTRTACFARVPPNYPGEFLRYELYDLA